MKKAKITAKANILGVLLALVLTAQSAWAAGTQVTCGPGGCTLGGTTPLFSETGLAPGAVVARELTAKNSYSEARSFAVEVSGSAFLDSAPSLGDEITITVLEKGTSVTLYGPRTINQWKGDGFVALSNIPAGGEKTYLFRAELSDVGNSYQDKALSFSFETGFATGEVLGEETEANGKVLAATGVFRAGIALLMLLALGTGIALRRWSKRLRRNPAPKERELV
jgi:hypothetical protein